MDSGDRGEQQPRALERSRWMIQKRLRMMDMPVRRRGRARKLGNRKRELLNFQRKNRLRHRPQITTMNMEVNHEGRKSAVRRRGRPKWEVEEVGRSM
ncbi:hypothetical protein BT69DRAFT_1238228 [Atractiella rhizophila]|nr:hypothetical protein BT69DRAFT_1238228 [Atractiella rhizophila]